MAIATVLDYSGKIDLNGNYCNSVDTIHDIPTLTNTLNPKHQTTTDYLHANSTVITKIESKINLYHNSWYIRPIHDWASYIDADTGLRELVAGQQHSGIGVFSYTFGNNGHAVVVYGKPEQIPNGYRISVYDNRYPNAPICIEINTSGSKWTGKMVIAQSYYEVIRKCKYENNFDTYDILDIDGEFNDAPNAAVFEDYCLLQICATGDFTISNAESETLSVTTDTITGDMETIRQNFTPNGEDGLIEYYFVVPISDSYTCTVNNGDTIEYFYVTAETGEEGIAAVDYPNVDVQQVTVNNICTMPFATIEQ